MSTQSEILELIREMPGIRSAEIAELMPHVKTNAAAAALTMMYAKGMVLRERHKPDVAGKGAPYYTYKLNPDPKPPVPVERKVKKPTESALNLRVAELEAKLAELTQWKEDAIARFPDLGVEPVVIAARKLVAKTLRAGGDGHLADDVLAGRKDTMLPMRVAIEALSVS